MLCIRLWLWIRHKKYVIRTHRTKLSVKEHNVIEYEILSNSIFDDFELNNIQLKISTVSKC